MTPWLLITFLGLILVLISLDLGLVTRRPRAVSPHEALASFLLWVLAAVLFSFLVSYVYQTNWMNLESEFSAPIGDRPVDINGHAAWLQFLTAYVVELALSMDNIAVMALLISYFRIPRAYVARTLFWSLMVSLLLRLGLIMGAAWLLRAYGWVYWAFGVVLVLAMLRTLVLPEHSYDFRTRWPTRPLLRLFRVSTEHRGQKLFARVDGRWAITPIMLVVLTASVLDATFAIDSVPAVFSVTRDPFLAYTASTFAVLGLRSLYIAVAHVVGGFRYLRISLVFVLLCVAGKMFIGRYDPHANLVTLVAVAMIILLGVGASALRNFMLRRVEGPGHVRPTPLEDLTEAVEVSRRNLRKVVILIVGTVVVLIGIVIAPLPGPGPVILVPIGLGLLATEFIWARRLLETLRAQSDVVQRRTDEVIRRTSILIVPMIVAGYWVSVVAASLWVPIKKPVVFWVVACSAFLPLAVWAWSAVIRWRRDRARRLKSTGADAAAEPGPGQGRERGEGPGSGGGV